MADPTQSVTSSEAPINSQEQVTQQPSYSKKNWKKWILIYLIIGAIIYAGFYYFVLAKKDTNPYTANYQTPATQPTTTVDETANWKTYINNSFTFKYPDTWTVKEPTPKDDFLYVHSPGSTESTPYFFVREIKNESSLPFVDLATSGLDKAFKNEFTYVKEIFGEYTIYKTESLPGRYGSLEAFVTRDGSAYILLGLTPYDSKQPWPNQESFLNIFNNALSTFRFE